ncbi:MAG: HAD family hydrolase [bacterium]
MIKTIFFDADGVTIYEEKRFGNRLADDYNIPYEKILYFFKGEFLLCSEGKADLKEEIVKYFDNWGWDKSLDELLKYWFEGTKTKSEILETVDKLKSNGSNCYLVTDQEKYRAGYISNDLNFDKIFDKCFYSCDIGYRKIHKQFFEKILKEINVNPDEILYWDDDDKNLTVANELGIKTELYSDFDSFVKKMQEYRIL